jgi:hypothetical protein
VRALALDTQVEQRFLQALQPDQLTLALAALAQLEQEEQAENKQWELRLERARYQAKRAERQYQAVEPENRLVIREVIIDSKRAEGQVWVQINWQTEAQEQFWYQRRVNSYAVFTGTQALEQRVRELNAAGLMDAQIAATLEREGYQTPGLVHPITSKIVCHLRAKWQIPTVKLNRNQQNPAQWEDGSYSVEGAAAKLGVSQDTIFTWLKTGRLKGEHLGRSMPWKIYVTEDDERRLNAWLRCQGRRTRRSQREAL